jgi:hypothetical protein
MHESWSKDMGIEGRVSERHQPHDRGATHGQRDRNPYEKSGG